MKNRSSPVTSGILVVLCTCPPDQAETLAELLIERKLAACVNVTPSVRSLYFWQGRMQRDEEALLIIKSSEAAWPALERTLKEHHPYEVPEIIALPVVRGSTAYLEWVEENLCTD